MKRVRIGLHRLLWLLLVPLLLSVTTLWLILAGLPQPQTLTFDRGGVTGTLASDDLFVAYDGQCTTVRWQFDGAQAVERDGAAVAAAGSAPLCADSRFRVTLPDGTSETMLMPWRFVYGHVVVLGAASVAVLVGGLVWGWGRRTASVNRQEREERQEKAGVRAGLSEAAGGRVWALALLVGVIAAAWGLRLAFAVRVPLYTDEAWTYLEFVDLPLTDGLPRFWTTNNHPFNTLLMHIALRVWGESELALRLPALWLGLLAVAAVYQAGRTLYSRQVGVAAAALSAAWPLLSEYGWQARGYTGVLVCTFVLLTLAARQARQPTRARWLAYALVTALGMYFVSTMIYAAALVSAWLVAQWWIADGVRIFRERRVWTLALTLVGAGLLTLALYTPQLHYLLTTPDPPPDPGAGRIFLPAETYLSDILITQFVPQMGMAGSGFSALGFVLLGVGIGAAWLAGCRPRGLASDPLLTILALGLLVLLAHRPTFVTRAWLFYLPLLAITGAAGWVWLGRLVTRTEATRWRLVGAASLAVIGVWGVHMQEASSGTPLGNEQALWDAAPALASVLASADAPAGLAITGDQCFVVAYYLERAGAPRPCLPYRRPDDPAPPDARLLLIVRAAALTTDAEIDETLTYYSLSSADYTVAGEPLVALEGGSVWLLRRRTR